MDQYIIHRYWMYDRKLPGKRALKPLFKEGIRGFVAFAMSRDDYKHEGGIRCLKCTCRLIQSPDDVIKHLERVGFMEEYWLWIHHGEGLPHTNTEVIYSMRAFSSKVLAENGLAKIPVEPAKNRSRSKYITIREVEPNSFRPTPCPIPRVQASASSQHPYCTPFPWPIPDPAMVTRGVTTSIYTHSPGRSTNPFSTQPPLNTQPPFTSHNPIQPTNVSYLDLLPFKESFGPVPGVQQQQQQEQQDQEKEEEADPVQLAHQFQDEVERIRASMKGGFLHLEGCVSAHTHARCMKKELGRNPLINKLHKRTHIRKGTTDTFVNDLSRDTQEAYEEKKRELLSHSTATSTSSSSSSSQQKLFEHTTLQLWKNVEGKGKNYKKYGLESLAPQYEA